MDWIGLGWIRKEAVNYRCGCGTVAAAIGLGAGQQVAASCSKLQHPTHPPTYTPPPKKKPTWS